MKDKKVKKPEVVKGNPEIEILKNQLARTLADYDNLQKRTDEERVSFIKYASRNILQSLLPIIDTFEAAQNHLKDAGLAIGISQLKELLKQEGLVEINPKMGDLFDENLMEVSEVIEGKDDAKVAETVMTGWRFADGNVLRHARVKVFKAEKAS